MHQVGGWGVNAKYFLWAVMVFSVFHVENEVSLSRAQDRECAVITNDTTFTLKRGQGSGSCLGHVGLGLGLGCQVR